MSKQKLRYVFPYGSCRVGALFDCRLTWFRRHERVRKESFPAIRMQHLPDHKTKKNYGIAKKVTYL